MPHAVTVINAHPTTRLRRGAIAAIVRRILREEVGRSAAIDVILVDDLTLRRMNRRFLGHDYDTDVLSFPLEDDPLEGEIYISVDRAREQARAYDVGVHAEVLRLAAHGALHLVGYDDATPEERRAMTDRENRYLAAFGG